MMPWAKNDYPPSMKNLDKRVRDKAVEIANALLKDGYEEGRAIAIATSQAEKWAEEHPGGGHEGNAEDREGGRKDSDAKARSGQRGNGSGGSIQHVVPHDGEWMVKDAGADKGDTYSTKAAAVEAARKSASDRGGSAIVHRADGTVETSHNYS
ncbi:Uncharacterized protein YdaT [Paenibacillus sp. RU4T]|nr:Uncharacterized protein YdaT [Paenibacillus sp. RU4X]SIR02103.1 Uncharacterized protein YdaT [Paenibacillus sp. RU4T]